MVLSKGKVFISRRLKKGSVCALRRVAFDVVERDERLRANVASVWSGSFHPTLRCIAPIHLRLTWTRYSMQLDIHLSTGTTYSPAPSQPRFMLMVISPPSFCLPPLCPTAPEIFVHTCFVTSKTSLSEASGCTCTIKLTTSGVSP